MGVVGIWFVCGFGFEIDLLEVKFEWYECCCCDIGFIGFEYC